MKVLLCGSWAEAEAQQWQQALRQALPQIEWLTAAQARAQASSVTAAVVANPAPGNLQGLPGLRLIQSLWAGVDRLLDDSTLPADVPVARMVDPAMTAAMAETALWAVLALHRGFFAYARRQAQGQWRLHAQRRAQAVNVLLLGQGVMGSAVAQTLQRQGYVVSSWRRQGRGAVGTTHPGRPLPSELQQALGAAHIVINLLPLTPLTRGLIDAHFLAALPSGAGLVNLARGAHLIEADLLSALDSGQVGHAVLDVFQTEPLPAEHAFWRHPRVTVLPHAAALTDLPSAAAVVADNLQRLAAGQPLLHLVDRQRGY